jgi:hypothetical protein
VPTAVAADRLAVLTCQASTMAQRRRARRHRDPES